MNPIPLRKCETCGRIDPAWYEDRDSHMTEAFLAGASTVKLGRLYRLSQQRVHEIIRNRLGDAAMWNVLANDMRD